MTEAATTTAGGGSAPATIRPYRPLDHHACRDLWAELTEHHRDLYEDPDAAGTDPGAGFEEYLTRLDLTGIWVADHAEDGVVGMVGLLLRGRAGEVEPVVVSGQHRGHGIGTALLEHLAREARRRGMSHLTVAPDSRNEGAIRCLYNAGYGVLSSVTLTLDLRARGHEWQDGIDLNGLRFSY
ncbi:MAG TPA: GNAT family N-acetyltransferase [Micromonosporaceae bacterium]|jgi:GNAT superfamily N-acetyltransferase|nr:GNAT family N-acetyltransferase [Micromonosporaceae bacterium]